MVDNVIWLAEESRVLSQQRVIRGHRLHELLVLLLLRARCPDMGFNVGSRTHCRAQLRACERSTDYGVVDVVLVGEVDGILPHLV